MVWGKRLTSVLLVFVVSICLIIMFEMPFEIRFVQAQFNYLFVAALYLALACLLMLRLSFIADVHSRRLLLVLASMLIVFPCLFVFSISLQQFYRVKNAAGVDAHLMLVHEIRQNEVFIREYSVRDQGLAETYGFGFSGEMQRRYQISHASQIYFPTKKSSKKRELWGNI